jgi:hypothetical protein
MYEMIMIYSDYKKLEYFTIINVLNQYHIPGPTVSYL